MPRLIDGDAVRGKAVMYFGKRGEMIGLSVPVKEIDNAPTVDAVPVVHGEWIASIIGKDVCSNCHKMFSSPPYGTNLIPRKEFKFCPSCGAKMDGERKGGHS